MKKRPVAVQQGVFLLFLELDALSNIILDLRHGNTHLRPKKSYFLGSPIGFCAAEVNSSAPRFWPVAKTLVTP